MEIGRRCDRFRARTDSETKGEADLSTQQAGAQAPSWLSRPLRDGGRPQSNRREARARPQEALCLIGPPSPLAAVALREDGKPEPAGEPMGRLTKRAEFQRVSRGRRVSAETFTLQSRRREASERETAGSPRVGLTVTKSVGGAVERNRVRRRLKEALRAAAPLEAESDHDYVLMARREALERRFAVLVDDVRHAFRAARRDGAGGRGRAPAVGAPKDEDRRT